MATSSDASMADELARVFTRVSGLLLSEDIVATALKLITSLAAQTVAGSAGAGVSLWDKQGGRVTAAATDSVVQRADSLQYQLGIGPCLTAWEDRVVVRVDDLARDERWPEWSRRVVVSGLRSSLSAPLVAGARPLGALKVYAREPGLYGARDEHLLVLFATQAAMLLSHMKTARDAERVTERLKNGLRDRELVALAKGVVMARDGVDERRAFLALAEAARRQGITLRQAAERLTQSTSRRRR
ncbi:GAF domain-containing protein [Saccharothrix tamanrassetensis]|uniref:GAF domain-containing protein n=1 Tax=Saccharothrix tamanrassetensis TaxID=1051531 RepID=A0A841CT53_9PSEU|nr:GAF and ANTAR domain-containing protein [Saccharothrix tamanrassetensis]MBB5958616.1 GAF domain-containing protein [Saccharothrix tamanrassetensis]